MLDALAVPECLNERAARHTRLSALPGSADVLATVQVMKAGAVDVLVKATSPGNYDHGHRAGVRT